MLSCNRDSTDRIRFGLDGNQFKPISKKIPVDVCDKHYETVRPFSADHIIIPSEGFEVVSRRQ